MPHDRPVGLVLSLSQHTHSVLDAGLQQHVWAVQYSKKAT